MNNQNLIFCINKQKIKSKLTQQIKFFSVQEISALDGPCEIEVSCTKFNCYFKRSNVKKLYVFLSAVGKSSVKYPQFHRVAWTDIYDGCCLCIDDPTREEINFAPSFYFGKCTDNYLDKIQIIVQNISNCFDIPSHNIFFIGSSNGGFASLYLANQFTNTNAIVLNPQFNIPLYFITEKSIGDMELFQKKIGIDFKDVNFKKRLNVESILYNMKSNFIIAVNLQARCDLEQISYIFKKINFEIKEGVYKFNNCTFVLYRINTKNPHLAQPDENFTRFLEFFTHKFDQDLIDIANLFSNLTKKIYQLQDVLNQTKIKE